MIIDTCRCRKIDERKRALYSKNSIGGRRCLKKYQCEYS